MDQPLGQVLSKQGVTQEKQRQAQEDEQELGEQPAPVIHTLRSFHARRPAVSHVVDQNCREGASKRTEGILLTGAGRGEEEGYDAQPAPLGKLSGLHSATVESGCCTSLL